MKKKCELFGNYVFINPKIFIVKSDNKLYTGNGYLTLRES